MKEKTTVGYTETENYRCLEDLEQVKHMEILDPLTLCYCGIEQCQPRFRFGPYVRNKYVIHVVLSGKGTYRVGKKEYTVSAGQAFLIRPGEETIYRADDQEPWRYTWIGFRGYKADTVVREMGFADGNYVVDLEDTATVEQEITNMLDHRGISYVNVLRRKSYFYSFLTHMVGENEKKKNIKENDNCDEFRQLYVRRATEYIMASYNKKIRISDIAEEIGLNRSYLSNIFKKEMNMSPQDFLITFRLEKAAQMLRESNESVRNIAYSTGYDDSLSFSKAFKQKYNMSPSAYRSALPELVNSENKGDYQVCCNL